MMECVIGSFMNVLWCVALLFIVQSIFALLIAQGLVGAVFSLKGKSFERGFWMEHGQDAPGADLLLMYFRTVPDIMVPCLTPCFTLLDRSTQLILLQSTTSGVDWGDPFTALLPTGPLLPAIRPCEPNFLELKLI